MRPLGLVPNGASYEASRYIRRRSRCVRGDQRTRNRSQASSGACRAAIGTDIIFSCYRHLLDWTFNEPNRLGNVGKREYALTLSGIPMAIATWDWEGRIGRRVRLRDLHVLSAVVRWGSMAKAAPHLAMSQSAVSEAIANLEDALRVRLLDRSPQGVEPTIYAQALLKRGDVVFDELKQGIKDIEFLSDPTAGEVRIACPEILSAWLVPATIQRLFR